MDVKAILKNFWVVVGFLSIVPTGRSTMLTPEDFGKFPAYYPAVGLLFGLDLFVVWYLAALVFPAQVAATLVVAMLIIDNRGFHVDGLADAADALLSHKSREQKLLIMKDSRQGTFGVLAIVLDVLLKVQLVAVVAPAAPWALILWPIWGRLAASVLAVRGVYVGAENGLGRWMVENSSFKELFWAALFTFAASLFGGGPALLAAAAAVVCGCALNWVWNKSLGGLTGDLLGATIELTEIFTLGFFYILL
ncbi:MAG: adenosylcobinamide-GDP ribazoletransferase [Candidatus Adiutrix sp.]|nr:adenosylcobinamide-GDP ribazoletransferase [Candidatus Adiutrix sp.]